MPLKRCPVDGLECTFEQCEGTLCKDRGDVHPDDNGVWHDLNGRVVPRLRGMNIRIQCQDIELEINVANGAAKIFQTGNGPFLSEDAANQLIKIVANDFDESLKALATSQPTT